MTRRRIRRMYLEARHWYAEGERWEMGYEVAAPAQSANRMAFNAGREAQRASLEKKAFPFVRPAGYGELPVDVWVTVLAEALRQWATRGMIY